MSNSGHLAPDMMMMYIYRVGSPTDDVVKSIVIQVFQDKKPLCKYIRKNMVLGEHIMRVRTDVVSILCNRKLYIVLGYS